MRNKYLLVICAFLILNEFAFSQNDSHSNFKPFANGLGLQASYPGSAGGAIYYSFCKSFNPSFSFEIGKVDKMTLGNRFNLFHRNSFTWYVHPSLEYWFKIDKDIKQNVSFSNKSFVGSFSIGNLYRFSEKFVFYIEGGGLIQVINSQQDRVFARFGIGYVFK